DRFPCPSLGRRGLGEGLPEPRPGERREPAERIRLRRGGRLARPGIGILRLGDDTPARRSPGGEVASRRPPGRAARASRVPGPPRTTRGAAVAARNRPTPAPDQFGRLY